MHPYLLEGLYILSSAKIGHPGFKLSHIFDPMKLSNWNPSKRIKVECRNTLYLAKWNHISPAARFPWNSRGPISRLLNSPPFQGQTVEVAMKFDQLYVTSGFHEGSYFGPPTKKNDSTTNLWSRVWAKYLKSMRYMELDCVVELEWIESPLETNQATCFLWKKVPDARLHVWNIHLHQVILCDLFWDGENVTLLDGCWWPPTRG